jgi:hypothetical protein
MSFFAPFGVLPLHLDASTDSEEVAEARELCLPFEKHYQLSSDRVERALKQAKGDQEPDRKDPAATPLFARYHDPREGWRRIDHDWLDASGGFALQLDGATNNTSLAFAIEVGRPGEGRVLLFPGDAQVGNWLSWEALEWKVKNGGQTRTVRSDDLLARTVLYKVGHHGSHNATLREKGLELMASNELTAMIPVNRVTAKKMDWLMPFPGLLRRLQEKTKGRIVDAETGLDDAAPQGLSKPAWKQFVAKTDIQTLWVDYTIEW